MLENDRFAKKAITVMQIPVLVFQLHITVNF